MKLFLHLLRCLLTIFLICCVNSVSMSVYAENSAGFTYSIVDGSAVVTGYEGKPEFIEIPHDIEGCPVSEIGERAFSSCNSLRRIIFPENLRKIGDYSFYACDSLEIAALPDGMESLGEGCFCGCTQLSYMKIPSGLTELPDSCFRACTNLSEVAIPSNIGKIGSFCFSGCTRLSYVSLGENLTEAGERAFYMCGSLDAMYLPNTLEKIGKEAFGFVPSDFGAAVRGGFTISGSPESSADKYAEVSGIRFSASKGSSHITSGGKNSNKKVKIPELTLIFVICILIVAMLRGKIRRLKHAN
ncbi:MAG: leucine-rich repeat domain-containing protein [Ruminococcus sp.]|nr:leucine-rich repeat domain-containing protein [Ruminococcus sp.]